MQRLRSGANLVPIVQADGLNGAYYALRKREEKGKFNCEFPGDRSPLGHLIATIIFLPLRI